MSFVLFAVLYIISKFYFIGCGMQVKAKEFHDSAKNYPAFLFLSKAINHIIETKQIKHSLNDFNQYN